MKQNDCLKLRPQEELIVLNDDLDHSAKRYELQFVTEAYRYGLSLEVMANKLHRDPDEISFMIFHLTRRGRITPRPSGAYGTVEGDGGPDAPRPQYPEPSGRVFPGPKGQIVRLS